MRCVHIERKVCNMKTRKNILIKRDESVEKNLTENMLFSGGGDPRVQPFVEMKVTDVSITHDSPKTEKE